MEYSKLIKKYNSDYNRKWFESILYIFDNYKCNIDIIDFFRNSNLTEELYNKITFITKPDKNYQYFYVIIEYELKKYKTPFILNKGYDIEFYTIFNPHFGRKNIIKILDSFDEHQFLKIFSNNILETSIEETLLYEIVNCVHFTPDIILKYLSKFINKPIDELNKHIHHYTHFVGFNYFWISYSKKEHINIEYYMEWPWNWENVLKYSKINIDFVKNYKEYIVDKIYSNYLEINNNFKRVIAEDLFNLNICYNKNICWKYKEKIIDIGFKYINSKINRIELDIDIGIPDKILREIVYNKNNRYSVFIYHIFKNEFLRYRYFPVDIVDYIYRNYRKYIEPVQLPKNEIIKNKNDLSRLLKCSCLFFTHDLFYCKYENISIDTINYFNNKKKNDYLEMDKMDLQLNKSFGVFVKDVPDFNFL